MRHYPKADYANLQVRTLWVCQFGFRQSNTFPCNVLLSLFTKKKKLKATLLKSRFLYVSTKKEKACCWDHSGNMERIKIMRLV